MRMINHAPMMSWAVPVINMRRFAFALSAFRATLSSNIPTNMRQTPITRFRIDSPVSQLIIGFLNFALTTTVCLPLLLSPSTTNGRSYRSSGDVQLRACRPPTPRSTTRWVSAFTENVAGGMGASDSSLCPPQSLSYDSRANASFTISISS